MTSELTCPECRSPIALTPSDTRCPVCESTLPDSTRRDRRTPTTVPFVRDWITNLRINGGDFSRTAARAANAIAYESFRRGLRIEEIFEVARAAYYTALDDQAPSTSSGAATSRRPDSDSIVTPLSETRALRMGQTA